MNMIKIFNTIINRYPKDVKEHAARVAEMCIKHGFDYMVIGLLHDIARFEQRKRYGTYYDKKTHSYLHISKKNKNKNKKHSLQFF